MIDDGELLRRFVADHSEVAFAELVQRHVGLVYGVALRRLGSDRHLAEDVAQKVFIDLARKAPALAPGVVLTGWLFTSARFAASRVARTESRRRHHEEQAVTMTKPLLEPSTTDWSSLRPLLDELIGKLPERDQQAVLLRFFEGHDYAEVGARLAVSADGARTRINRALEKLQALLMNHGVTSTTAALTGALATQSAVAVPEGLVMSITAAAVAGKGTAGVLIFLSMNKAILGITAALAVAGLAGFVIQRQANADLRSENNELLRQSATNAALQADNARLIQNARELADELSVARSEHSELARTREEIATLKRQAATARPGGSAGKSQLAAGMIPTGACANVGMGTPAASYETMMWAHRQVDVDALARLITFGDADKAQAAAQFAGLSEETRAKLGSPEKMIALMFAAGPEHAGFQVVSQTSKDEKTILANIAVQKSDGSISKAQIVFARGAEGWQLVVPAGEVMSQIRKLTGELPPKG
jgi:RNA polymerase sigma factor (sigma-70 family)